MRCFLVLFLLASCANDIQDTVLEIDPCGPYPGIAPDKPLTVEFSDSGKVTMPFHDYDFLTNTLINVDDWAQCVNMYRVRMKQPCAQENHVP